MGDKFDINRKQKGYRGPYVMLSQDEINALLVDLGNKPLNRTLAGLRERCANAVSPIYGNMRKPL